MKIFTFLMLVGFSLVGCVKVKILPDNAVRNTYDASKELISKTKLKRSGGLEREYSKQLLVSDYESQDQAEAVCDEKLTVLIQNESPRKAPVVLSRKHVLISLESHLTIECSVVAYIWPAK